ncbi:hypothetical protein TNCV_3563731 [Trichonephila clavipes]|nr:hypothetical protein TNCV_3563731 [Trichonephila clavipes]
MYSRSQRCIVMGRDYFEEQFSHLTSPCRENLENEVLSQIFSGAEARTQNMPAISQGPLSPSCRGRKPFPKTDHLFGHLLMHLNAQVHGYRDAHSRPWPSWAVATLSLV